jgi:hypothetical protein
MRRAGFQRFPAMKADSSARLFLTSAEAGGQAQA